MLGSEASLNGLELSAEAYYRIGSTASLPYLEPDAQVGLHEPSHQRHRQLPRGAVGADPIHRPCTPLSCPLLQMQDVLRILPASSNLAAAAPQASGGAATATDSDTETPMHGLPRVASLDFIRQAGPTLQSEA